MDIMKRVITEANRLGLAMVGYTDTYRADFIKSQIELRRHRGMDTEFDQVDIEDRTCPEKILKGWKGIISFGLSYNISREELSGDGVLSRCSLGPDYHGVLSSRIESIMKSLSGELGFNYRVGVDTTPLLDREIARLSGIGYQGKNTNLINKSYGSFIFLGYALVDIEIKDYSYNRDYSTKRAEDCGSCDICQKSCPTGSINGDYTINARTCLAYITQTKARIPYEVRYKMGNRIYGCDTCQEVCPKNREVLAGDKDVFTPVYLDRLVDLIGLATISNREFKESYAKTSSGWRGKNILRRNAVIAMGNSGNRKYLGVLAELMVDNSEMVAEYAIWAMLNIDFDYGYSLLEKRGSLIRDHIRDEVDSMIRYMEEK